MRPNSVLQLLLAFVQQQRLLIGQFCICTVPCPPHPLSEYGEAPIRTYADLDRWLAALSSLQLASFNPDIFGVSGLCQSTLDALGQMTCCDPNSTPEVLHLYVDGSYCETKRTAGWAVVALSEVAGVKHWLGFWSGSTISFPVPTTQPDLPAEAPMPLNWLLSWWRFTWAACEHTL